MVGGAFRFVIAWFVFWVLSFTINPALIALGADFQLPPILLLFGCLLGAGWVCSK